MHVTRRRATGSATGTRCARPRDGLCSPGEYSECVRVRGMNVETMSFDLV